MPTIGLSRISFGMLVFPFLEKTYTLKNPFFKHSLRKVSYLGGRNEGKRQTFHTQFFEEKLHIALVWFNPAIVFFDKLN